MNHPSRWHAFTLIELIVSLSIVSCLMGLIVPTLGSVISRGHSAICVNNLRQIGVAGLLYAGENNQTLPVIEPWPSNPVYPPSEGVQPIADVLGPYGVNNKVLECHQDIIGPNFHSCEGSSYEWCPMANGQNLQGMKITWGNMPEGLTFSRLAIAFDYSNIHGGLSNVLFGDGHVVASGK